MKDRWKSVIGDYICEIDSIDTLFAPDMVRILRAELSRYIPPETVKTLQEYEEQVRDAFDTYHTALDDQIQNVLQEITDEIHPKVAPIIEELEPTIEIDISNELQDLINTRDDFEEPEWEVDDGEDEWLFDSSRTYEEQLKMYKKIRGWQ